MLLVVYESLVLAAAGISAGLALGIPFVHWLHRTGMGLSGYAKDLQSIRYDNEVAVGGTVRDRPALAGVAAAAGHLVGPGGSLCAGQPTPGLAQHRLHRVNFT